MEASDRNVTSVIKDNIEEIRTSGVLQSETMGKLQMTLRDFQQRGFYKGVVRSFGKRVKISLLIFEPLQVRGSHSRGYIPQGTYFICRLLQRE